MNEPKDTFKLNSNDDNFNERQKNVFDQLKLIENNIKNVQEQIMDVEEETEQLNHAISRRSHRSATKHFRGKESIFKKPQLPTPKNVFNRIPDFKKNPHKWTKYTLDDVQDEDISDRANTKAALSFLKELKTRKSSDNDEDMDETESSDAPTKIVFKKQYVKARNNQRTSSADADEEKATFRSSKVVMPEYVVGQKVAKNKKNKKVVQEGKGKELKLDHLLEEEDNE